MADFTSDFRTFLAAQASVSAIVSGRIYPDMLKQGCSLPALMFEETGGEVEGCLTSNPGLGETMVRLWCYAATSAAARNLDTVVKTVLDDLNQSVGAGTFITSAVSLANRDTGADLEEAAKDQKRFWTARVYSIHHTSIA